MTAQTVKALPAAASEIAAHYSSSDLGARILGGLARAGKDVSALKVDDLAPVDEFHIRGRDATVELSELVDIPPEAAVLDMGSGIGGTARYLAAARGCHVTGIDLVDDYCALARELSARVGLDHRTTFRQGSATELPFHDESFDLVWTEHVQMNIENKLRFYAEAARVLRAGGRFVFHDIFAGPDGELAFPVPWATSRAMSFLVPGDDARRILLGLGLRERAWVDTTAASQAWFEAAVQRSATQGPPALGLHLVMGATAKQKFSNVLDGFRAGAITTVQAVFER